MFERRHERLLSRFYFYVRLARNFSFTLGIVVFSLLLGSAGYRYFGDMDWVDALHNASMILTGMGPISPMTTTPGKLFASFYALYSGIAFLSMTAVLLAPIAHRFMHKFHLDEESGKPRP